MPSELICCSPVEFHIGTKVTWWRLSEGHYWYSLALPSNITLTTVDDKDDDEHQYHHHPKTSANDHFGNYWVRKLTQGHRAAAPRCTYVTVELLIHTLCIFVLQWIRNFNKIQSVVFLCLFISDLLQGAKNNLQQIPRRSSSRLITRVQENKSKFIN